MADAEILLLRRFAETSDAEAFSEITQRYAGMVYASCRRVLGNEAKAADATQETFFQLFKNAGEITGSLGGWLHRVATRKSVDMIRMDSARASREKSYAGTAKKEINEWQELSPYVDQAMEELDDDIREMLVRHYLGGKSMRLVGEDMGVSQATVSRKIEKGVSQLRSMLEQKGLVISITILGSMLLTNTLEAAPAVVMSELGKMAIAGTTAAGAGAAVGASTATAGTKAAGIGIAAGIKAKVAVAVVVATVGTGAVVKYNQVNEPVEPEAVSYNVTTNSVDTGGLDISATATANNNRASEESWDKFWDELSATSSRSNVIEGDVYFNDGDTPADKSTDDDAELPPVQQFAGAVTVPVEADTAADAEDPNDTEIAEEEAAPPGGGMGGFGGMRMGGGMMMGGSSER